MENISSFLARLGFPLHNTRWSWGAHSDFGVLLTTWESDLDETGHFVRVLDTHAQTRSSPGLNERMDHLRTLWSGGLAGYAVIATAKDTKAKPRQIQSYDDQNVRAIVSLAVSPDGTIWAELGDDVPVANLKKHASSHRLIPCDCTFPVAHKASKAFKDSSAAYIAKLPAMREWLIDIARRGETTTYAKAREPFGMRSLEHRHAMDRIGHACVDAGEPVLTSLIVDEVTGRCSAGFFKAFRRDDAEERQDCYAFWSSIDTASSSLVEISTTTLASRISGSHNEALQDRAARFAKAAVRPEQAAFRRRVFLEHKGACLVTGCTIPEALDAAHKQGRNWRLGHNSGADGLLLRKDIHALYDANLIDIADGGTVVSRHDVATHYQNYLRKS